MKISCSENYRAFPEVKSFFRNTFSTAFLYKYETSLNLFLQIFGTAISQNRLPGMAKCLYTIKFQFRPDLLYCKTMQRIRQDPSSKIKPFDY